MNVGPYAKFVPGVELSAAFYADAVAPVMLTAAEEINALLDRFLEMFGLTSDHMGVC